MNLYQKPLARRERWVLRLYADGVSHGEIAAVMGIKPSTVQEYMHRIKTKFGGVGTTSMSRAEVLRIGRLRGLIR